MKLHRRSSLIRYQPWLIPVFLLLFLSSNAVADFIRVKGTVVNVRQGPGTTQPVLFQAEQGEEFQLLGTEGLWCHIRLQEGREAWVYAKLVDILPGKMRGTSPTENGTQATQPPGKGWSPGGKLAFTLFLAVIFLLCLWKRRQILHYAGRRLREISGYKRDQAFRYDDRKPSDDSWEI